MSFDHPEQFQQLLGQLSMKPREQAQVVEERVVAQIHHDPSLCLFASYLTIKKGGTHIKFWKGNPQFLY